MVALGRLNASLFLGKPSLICVLQCSLLSLLRVLQCRREFHARPLEILLTFGAVINPVNMARVLLKTINKPKTITFGTLLSCFNRIFYHIPSINWQVCMGRYFSSALSHVWL